MPLYLAHDGSLNGDWVANYALRLAHGTDEPRLTLLHVEDANISGTPLQARIDAVVARGRNIGVDVAVEIAPMSNGVFGGLVDRLPKNPETVVVCGARNRDTRRGALSGTISERLLMHGGFNVFSVRVLQPGLLGNPQRIMLPIPTQEESVRHAIPFLRLLAPDMRRLHLLTLAAVGHRQFRAMSQAAAAELQHQARGRMAIAETIIARQAGIALEKLDGSVRVTDDVPKQIAVEAGRQRSGLIMVEMPAGGADRSGFGHPTEEIMRIAPCDVAAYRGVNGDD